ncbi:hypothetical protein TIFTF001_028692 [Ficus carica]|uniref:Uncharacterized protein n=1 Tax=Ficus carica TaxID=3494 RepID=A0AA88DQT8_FICCA|nr:hypothetical protein TIFTF001_028692 [Ficus carica]
MSFRERDLVLKTVDHVRRQISRPSKFSPNWEGPFVVKEAYDSGYYGLISVLGGAGIEVINGKWLKRYYC